MFDFLKPPNKEDSSTSEMKPKLEVALQEISELSQQAQEEQKDYTAVEKVPEKFLILLPHMVTGKELNTATAHIEESIILTKNMQIETLRHLTQLYQALDALDGEYVTGILDATEAAEKAKNLASINDKNIGKIIDYLTQDDQILKSKEAYERRITDLESKIKAAYFVACGAIVVAVASLVLCLITLI